MYRTLSKYLVGEFLKLLAICEGVFIFLYLAIDMIGAIDNFLEKHVATNLILKYFILKVPLIATQMLPPATLIAVIIMFALMKKNNEIMLLNACGVNIWSISQPVIMTSLFVIVGLFLCSEIIVPYTSTKGNQIWRIEVLKRNPAGSGLLPNIWYRGEKCIFWMRFFDSRDRVMIDPSLYFFDDSFHVIKKIDGSKGTWEDGRWRIVDGMVLEVKENNSDYSSSKFHQLDLELPEGPDTFLREEKDPEEMGYWQLKRFVERLEREGYDAAEYAVSLHLKVAFPFIVLLMVIIGIPISLMNQKGGAPVAVAMGLFVCLFYMLFLGFFRSLGLADIMPPILSAWMANGLFFLGGTYLIMHVNQ